MNPPNWESRLIYNKISRTTGLTLLSASLFTFSYTPSPFSFFIFVAFIPFLRMLENKSVGESFRCGYLLGLVVNLLVFYWLIYFKFSTYILIVVLNPLQFALFAAIFSYFKTKKNNFRLIIFPFIWTALEYFREMGDLALNWLNIGYTQANFISVIQFVEFTGLNGITFWICFINLIIYLWIFNKFPKIKNYVLIFVLISLFFIPYVHGILKTNKALSSPGISAIYVQPNINSSQKWDKQFMPKNMEILFDMSKNYVNEGLVVWPETAIPFALQEIKNEISVLKHFTKQQGINLLSGILNNSAKSQNLIKYNSAILLSHNSDSLQIYNKIKLVPMEEGLPFSRFYANLLPGEMKSKFYGYGMNKKIFEFPAKIFNIKFQKNDWNLVDKQLKMKNTKMAAVVCFESSFPSFISDFVKEGAEILVVITNDEWFGFSPQSLQHLLTSRFRAIENRISVIHCSNAGVSAFVDPFGKFYNQSQLYEKTTAAKIIPLKFKQTFFTKHGDLTGIFCIYITLLLVPLYFIFKRIVK